MSSMAIRANLLTHLGNDAYSELVDLLDQNRIDSIKATIEQSEDKFERRLIEVKCELKDEMSDMRDELKDEMRNQIKWIVGLWVTQMIAIIGFFSATFFYILQKV